MELVKSMIDLKCFFKLLEDIREDDCFLSNIFY